MTTHDGLALRGPAIIPLVFATAMLILWGLVSAGVDEIVVPSPHDTAEQFMRAMKAHRFEAAHDLLSEQARDEVEVSDLRSVVRSLEERGQSISDAQGEGSHKEQDTALATTRIKTEGSEPRVLEFRLVREQGVWKVGAIDPLRELVGH